MSETVGADWYDANTPGSSLLRWQLIEVGSGPIQTKCPLSIDPRIFHYLLGEPGFVRQLEGIFKPLPETPKANQNLSPSHQKVALELAGIWNSLTATAESSPPIVQLCGNEMATLKAIAVSAGAKMGRSLSAIAAHFLPTNPNEL